MRIICREIANQTFDYFAEFFPSAAELTNLMQFEEECLADYFRKKYDIHSTSKEERMRLMLERYDILREDETGKVYLRVDNYKG